MGSGASVYSFVEHTRFESDTESLSDESMDTAMSDNLSNDSDNDILLSNVLHAFT
jgi:hypothetical protein